MKKTALVFTVMIFTLLVPSCSVEEMEQHKPQPVEIKNAYDDAMMQRDSVSKTEDEIDPPTKPVIVGTRP